MKDKFTIVITCYNQEEYIYNALHSVFIQDYNNIEIIITDDASRNFNKSKVEKYIKENRKDNIREYCFIINKKNIGTVKTLNKAIRNSKGKYITFFAADDELSNENVISNYARSFEKFNQRVITAQCYLYDDLLINNNGEYVNVKEANKFNKADTLDTFIKMVKGCFYGSGGTAYNKNIFEEFGCFNEKVKLVEDWAYYLHLLKNGIRIYFVDFPALNHRDGGMSHHNITDELPPHVKTYYNDLAIIQQQIILNDMPKLSDIKAYHVFQLVKTNYQSYQRYLNPIDIKKYNGFIKESMLKYFMSEKNIKLVEKKLKIYNFFKWHVYYKFKYLYKSNRVLSFSIVYWIIFNLLYLNSNPSILQNTNNEIIYLVSLFLIILYINNFLNKIGDNMIFCLPITTLVSYGLFKIFIINSIFTIFIPIIIYIIIYYILYIIRIYFKKTEQQN